MGGSVRGSTLIRAQPGAVQARIREALDAVVEPYRAGDVLEVPVAANIASGLQALSVEVAVLDPGLFAGLG